VTEVLNYGKYQRKQQINGKELNKIHVVQKKISNSMKTPLTVVTPKHKNHEKDDGLRIQKSALGLKLIRI